MAEVTIFIAFFAGILSFLSPCILPIVPGFLAYLSGTSIKDSGNQRMLLFLNSLMFVIGFSAVFALLGVLLNTLLSGLSSSVQEWLSRIAGILILIFAFYILGLIKIPFLEVERKVHVKKRFGSTYITSFLFGAAFAVGWSPCVGAILGSVFALAIKNPVSAFSMLMAYAIGMGIPFLVVGLFASDAIKLIRKSGTFLKYFNIIVGILLLILGVLVFTNNLSLAAAWVPGGALL